MDDRSTTAPNGATLEDFIAWAADLQAEGRGARGRFALIEPEGNDVDGIATDLLCLDAGGQEFHGYYSTATYDAEGAVMDAGFVLSEFWKNCLQAAWAEVDSLRARED